MTETAATKYAPPLIALHWLMALLIFALYASGLSVDSFPKPDRPFIVNLHALGGILMIILLILRVILKVRLGAPDYPSNMGPLFQKAAKAGHGLIYLLMIATPLIGVPAFLFRGQSLNFGLFDIPSPLAANKDLAHSAHGWHELAAHVLIALVVGHALVALYHQFALRDNLLARMKFR